MLRWASVVLVAVLASGCTAYADVVPAPVPLDRVLVRVFVDDIDGDGEREAHIRFAGQAGTDVRPFAGDVEIVLLAHGGAWRPTAWGLEVQPHEFVDAVLPYYEVTAPAARIAPGQQIEVRVEAELPDGRVLFGSYVTWA